MCKLVPQPEFYFDATPGKYYSLMLIDIDVLGCGIEYLKPVCFWWIYNINGSNTDQYNIGFEYLSPTAIEGSDCHRLIALIFDQGTSTTCIDDLWPERVCTGDVYRRCYFDMNRIPIRYNWGPPKFGNCIWYCYDPECFDDNMNRINQPLAPYIMKGLDWAGLLANLA